jgi:hypothetical protein
MNDSNLHEVSDGIGYTRSLVLSIGIHILLASALWVGASINQSPDGKSAGTENSSSNGTKPVMPPAQALSASPSTNPRPAANQLLASESKRWTSKPAANGIDAEHATQRAPNAPTINRSTTTPKQARSEPGKFAQLKNAQRRPKTPAAKPAPEKKYLAKATAKTKHVAAKPITKVEQTRIAKNKVLKEHKNTPSIAETKKLESMREAEMRRISASVS